MRSWLQDEHYKRSVNGQLQYPHFYFVSLSYSSYSSSQLCFSLLPTVRPKERQERTWLTGWRDQRPHTSFSLDRYLLSSIEEGNTIRVLRAIHHPRLGLSGISLLTFRRSEEENEPSQCSLAFRLHASSGKLRGRALTRRKRMPFLRTSMGSNS